MSARNAERVRALLHAHGPHPVLRDERGALGRQELGDEVQALCKRLEACDLRPRHVLALCGLGARETLVSLLAGWSTGLVVAVLSPREPRDALAERMLETQAALLLCGDAVSSSGLSGAQGLGEPLVPRDVAPPLDLRVLAATLLRTSGSGGQPKWAVHGLDAYLHSAQRSAAALTFGPGCSWRLSLPLHHVGGLGILMRALSSGGTVEVPPAALPCWQELRLRDVTHLSMVPTQLIRALEAPGGPESLASLQQVLLGGAPVAHALRQRTLDAGIALRVSYGSTESTGLVTLTRSNADALVDGGAGTPLTPNTVRVDSDGEILLAGESLFLGYLRAGRLVVPRTSQGWIHSGDLGQMDAQGRLTIQGRRDRLFISGGENIQPEAIERALLAIEGVAHAIVVPQPDREYGHVAAAFVAGHPELGAAVLRAALRESLPGFMVPRAFYRLETTALKPSYAEVVLTLDRAVALPD